ncbi:MAG TPA: UDP-N-acetylmuramoyl-tripeptide--D-alanyl-D-alanine ligase [Xanthomonadales bacterium]|nr:UDP-N-acetylmuramoyl-tripeptide--D-alanyl-D-alanine ligase [Xanthomonadales bacterium]
MISLELREVARLVGCPEPDTSLKVDSIVTDSRKVQYGTLFAALKGIQVDGHDYAETAVSLGAVAVLASRKLELEVPVLVVEDVIRALGIIAAEIRNRVDPIVVGITGSNGKTTVKEMVASILKKHCGKKSEVLATGGNYNNELGLPLSLFGLKKKHRYAVLEMGASQAGDIAYLAGIGRPDVSVITNVGPAHLKGFGSESGVAHAKGEIFQALGPGGCAVIFGDQHWSELWHEINAGGRVITFGQDPANDVRVVDRETLDTPKGRISFELPVPGIHNRVNAAAATAVALALDVDPMNIREGLAAFRPAPGRLETKNTDAGWTIIDDSYNANPASLYSALKVLSEMQGHRWLVVGDMKELGENSHKLHAEIGDAASSLGVERVFAIGEMTAATVRNFGRGGMHFEDHDSLIEALTSEIRPGINCLIKGSRSMNMERVVKALEQASESRMNVREAG